jgi:hypothetical protein
VRLASAQQPLAKPANVLVLPGGKSVLRRSLALKSGQKVRGRDGQRPVIVVPREGLVVRQEGVCFEGIDFIWQHEADQSARGQTAAMIVVEAQSVEFRQCSFSSAGEGSAAAVAWLGAESPLAGGGELAFFDCVLRETAAAVHCLAAPQLAVQWQNSLCVNSGPLLYLHRPPRGDEAITVTLEHVTTRGDSPVLACRGNRDEASGPISISAIDCVLATETEAPLLMFLGFKPDKLLGTLAWSGHGSLLTLPTSLAVWRTREKPFAALSDDAFEVAGLARSAVQFAGEQQGPPTASRVTRWQAPLRSAEPPGARVHALWAPSPEVGLRTAGETSAAAQSPASRR